MHLCPLLTDGFVLGLGRVFRPWDSNIPCSKSTPGRGMFSPNAPRVSLYHAMYPGAISLFPRKPQLCSWESHTLPKPEFEFQMLFEKQQNKTKQTANKQRNTCGPFVYFLPPSPMVREGFLFCELSAPLFLFVSSLCGKGSLPPWHRHFSVTQFTSTHLAPPMLSPSDSGDGSATPHTHCRSISWVFLGVDLRKAVFAQVVSVLYIFQVLTRYQICHLPTSSPIQ